MKTRKAGTERMTRKKQRYEGKQIRKARKACRHAGQVGHEGTQGT